MICFAAGEKLGGSQLHHPFCLRIGWDSMIRQSSAVEKISHTSSKRQRVGHWVLAAKSRKSGVTVNHTDGTRLITEAGTTEDAPNKPPI